MKYSVAQARTKLIQYLTDKEAMSRAIGADAAVFDTREIVDEDGTTLRWLLRKVTPQRRYTMTDEGGEG